MDNRYGGSPGIGQVRYVAADRLYRDEDNGVRLHPDTRFYLSRKYLYSYGGLRKGQLNLCIKRGDDGELCCELPLADLKVPVNESLGRRGPKVKLLDSDGNPYESVPERLL